MRRVLFRLRERMRREAILLLRAVVVGSNVFPPLYWTNTLLYWSVLKLCVLSLQRCRAVKGIYLRHSMLTEDFVPGESDIDLTVVIEDGPDEEYHAREVLRRYFSFKKFALMLGEMDILVERELKLRHPRYGNAELCEGECKRLWGMREFLTVPAETGRSSRSFELNVVTEVFNKFYGTVCEYVLSHSISWKNLAKEFLKILRLHFIVVRGDHVAMRASRKEALRRLQYEDVALHRLLVGMNRRRGHACLDGDSRDAITRLFGKVSSLTFIEQPGHRRTVVLKVVNRFERETQSYVRERMRPIIGALEEVRAIKSVQLRPGGMANCGAIGNYSYKLYVVMDGSDLSRYGAVLEEVAEVYAQYRQIWPHNYLLGGCRMPLLITEQLLAFATRFWDWAWEWHSESRGSAVGNIVVDDRIIGRAIDYFVFLCRDFRWNSLEIYGRRMAGHEREMIGTEGEYIRELKVVDYVFSLAYIRLLLDKHVMAMSPRDVLGAYREEYQDEGVHWRWLDRFHAAYSNLRPAGMAVALEADEFCAGVHSFVAHQQRALHELIQERYAE